LLFKVFARARTRGLRHLRRTRLPAVNPTALKDDPAFTGARDHLNAHFGRIQLMVQRYMRRYADRLLQADGSYADVCVSPQELRRLLGLGESIQVQEWLDQLGIPPSGQVAIGLLAADETIEERTAAGAAAALPIEQLRDGFMLSGTELDLLIAAAAPRLSVDLSRLYAVAWADYSVRQPTAGFLAELVAEQEDEVEDVLALLGDGSRLTQYRLLVPGQHDLWRPETPRVHAPMQVPQRILDYLAGDALHSAVIPGCTLHRGGQTTADLILDDATQQSVASAMQRLRPRLLLTGPRGAGRRTLARSCSLDAGCDLLEVDLARALAGRTNNVMERFAEVVREARLFHASIFIRVRDLSADLVETLSLLRPSLEGLLSTFPGAVFVSDRKVSPVARILAGDSPEVPLAVPQPEDQAELWCRALTPLMGDDVARRIATEISRSYRLPPGEIFGAVETAISDAQPGDGLDATKLINAVRKRFDHGLTGLTDLVDSPMGFDDVVLRPHTRDQVQEVMMFARHSDQVFRKWGFAGRSHSGNGLSVLFSGPPGTGKTLMAGVLARHLGRVLYRVDLSRIVDKYIGETEKNLGRVFDEAERAQAVLLFDEADSLFAKRTQVKSSNDRYANLEVNYLLQRLEGYDGVSILTTNFATCIDDAFQRRIRFKIEFPMPEAKERAELWRRLLPPGAPVEEEIDWKHLGECFVFSGGHIRNCVLRAAIHAAERATAICEDDLYNAGVAEGREMGSLILDKGDL
jgi:AAA+ superfamily predicted ATPase